MKLNFKFSFEKKKTLRANLLLMCAYMFKKYIYCLLRKTLHSFTTTTTTNNLRLVWSGVS